MRLEMQAQAVFIWEDISTEKSYNLLLWEHLIAIIPPNITRRPVKRSKHKPCAVQKTVQPQRLKSGSVKRHPSRGAKCFDPVCIRTLEHHRGSISPNARVSWKSFSQASNLPPAMASRMPCMISWK
jgi:hypothetical protein